MKFKLIDCIRTDRLPWSMGALSTDFAPLPGLLRKVARQVARAHTDSKGRAARRQLLRRLGGVK